MAQVIERVQGHDEIWAMLLRQARHLPHAMAFVGAPGIGKKTVAWALAQALLCERDPRPCGECGNCRRVENQQSESILYVEPEKGTIKLDATEKILEFLSLRRLGAARVVIIDGAHTLNPQAANALLKVLEEPPPQTYFILLIHELAQLLPTLRSRLQVVQFSPLNAQILKQGQPEAAAWMIRSARGSFARLENFAHAESEELRQAALQFLVQAFRAQRAGLDHLMDISKDRESALSAIQFLQQFLRDWSVLGQGEIIHSDCATELSEFPPRSVAARIALWRKAFTLETDFYAHVDRALLFENFYYRTQEQESA